jgi:hypothetical protein
MGRTYRSAWCCMSSRLEFHLSEIACKIRDEWLLWWDMALPKGEVVCVALLLIAPCEAPCIWPKMLWSESPYHHSGAKSADIRLTGSQCLVVRLPVCPSPWVELLPLLLCPWTSTLVPWMPNLQVALLPTHTPWRMACCHEVSGLVESENYRQLMGAPWFISQRAYDSCRRPFFSMPLGSYC